MAAKSCTMTVPKKEVPMPTQRMAVASASAAQDGGPADAASPADEECVVLGEDGGCLDAALSGLLGD